MTAMKIKIALFVLAAALSFGCGKSDEEATKNDTNSSALSAPEFIVTSYTGEETFSLDGYKGKVLILDFWATWCGPCKREIPHFNELYAKYQDKGLEILGVSLDEQGPGAVERFVSSIPIDYGNAMANREVVTAYGPISAIPTTFVIDRKGRVQRRFVGYQDVSVFEEVLQQLL